MGAQMPRRSCAVNILICEDNPVIAMDLSWMLEDMGYHICGTAELLSRAWKSAPSASPTSSWWTST
jgi:CheY-like chemotaxis protein